MVYFDIPKICAAVAIYRVALVRKTATGNGFSKSLRFEETQEFSLSLCIYLSELYSCQ